MLWIKVTFFIAKLSKREICISDAKDYITDTGGRPMFQQIKKCRGPSWARQLKSGLSLFFHDQYFPTASGIPKNNLEKGT